MILSALYYFYQTISLGSRCTNCKKKLNLNNFSILILIFNFLYILHFRLHYPNSKTLESSFEPYYAVNKMWEWFVHNCSNVNSTKNYSPIIHQFMFHYGCFRFMKRCNLLQTYLCAIIVQFRNQTKLGFNCVSIDPWGMRSSWLTFRQLWPKLGTMLFIV